MIGRVKRRRRPSGIRKKLRRLLLLHPHLYLQLQVLRVGKHALQASRGTRSRCANSTLKRRPRWTSTKSALCEAWACTTQPAAIETLWRPRTWIRAPVRVPSTTRACTRQTGNMVPSRSGSGRKPTSCGRTFRWVRAASQKR